MEGQSKNPHTTATETTTEHHAHSQSIHWLIRSYRESPLVAQCSSESGLQTYCELYPVGCCTEEVHADTGCGLHSICQHRDIEVGTCQRRQLVASSHNVRGIADGKHDCAVYNASQIVMACSKLASLAAHNFTISVWTNDYQPQQVSTILS